MIGLLVIIAIILILNANRNDRRKTEMCNAFERKYNYRMLYPSEEFIRQWNNYKWCGDFLKPLGWEKFEVKGLDKPELKDIKNICYGMKILPEEYMERLNNNRIRLKEYK
jgi:hypothetical protein